MATLTPGKPVTVATPELLVENPLPEGRYRFQLVAIDDSGLESDPAELVVTVQASRPSTGIGGIIGRADILREVLRPTGPVNPVNPLRRPQ